MCALLVAVAIAICPRICSAEDDEQTVDPGPLATTAAVLGGVIAPGVGHAVGGDWESAKSLAKLRGLGLALAGAGGLLLGATGASRRVGGLPVALLVSGSGLVLVPWWADIYGSAGGGRSIGIPRVDLPRAELELSYAHVNDPQFAYSHFAVFQGDVGLSSFRFRPSLWWSTNTDNQRGRLEVAYRMRGPGASRPSGDGSGFELRTAGGYQLYPEESYKVVTGELSAAGRYDMARLSPSLNSSFMEMSLGLGLERIGYDVPGASADWSDLLIGGFAYGMYLGRRGELSVYYEHRRDGYVGGISPGRKNGSGFLGHFGAGGYFYVTPSIGVTADYAAGAAHVARVGLRVQLGGPM